MTTPDTLKCLDDHLEGADCGGTVELRFPLSGTGRSFPRCDKHWDARLVKQQEINERYAPTSDVPPAGFDPAYAGESWEEGY